MTFPTRLTFYFAWIIVLGLGIRTGHAQYYGMTSSIEDTWSIGLRTGMGWVQGDVAAEIPTLDVGIFGQKYLSKGLDLRFGVNAGQYKGQDFTPTASFSSNRRLNGDSDSVSYYPEGSSFFQNYQMKWFDGYFQLKVNFNRLFSQYGTQDWEIYGLAGMGAFFYQTYMDAFDSEGNLYDYAALVTDVSEKPEILEELEAIQDGQFETLAERDFINSRFFRGFAFNTQLMTGLGVRLPISEVLSVGLQMEYLIMGDDLLDGQQWGNENSPLEASTNNDRLIRLGLTLDAKF